MIKQKLKKILIIMTIIILAISTQQVNAETFENNEIESTYTLAQIEAKGGTSAGDAVAGSIGWLLDGAAGVVFKIFQVIPLLIARVMMSIISLAINGTEGVVSGMSIDKVLFNDIPLLGINFFETAENGYNVAVINDLRDNIAAWYVSIRNLAIVILAIMAVYVGIRMAISTVAEDKAKYKQMLVDWLVSLALLFVLHYIMIFIINLNNSMVDLLRTVRDNSITSNGATSVLDEIFEEALKSISFIKQLSLTFIYFMLCVMTFMFFITYVKRMVTIAFLIMISPIITVTYSIDRMGDGKSQALNTWLKEFIYNILLQPFQCIIYLALVQTSVNALAKNSTNLGEAIICIVMILFLYQAEDLVKHIFHFESKSVANTIAQAAIVSSAVGLVGKAAGSKAKGGSNNTGGRRQPRQANQNPNPNPNRQNPTIRGAVGSVVGGFVRNAAKTGLNEMRKLPKELFFTAAGAATGNLSAAITGFQTGRSSIEQKMSQEAEEDAQNEFAREYNDIVDANGQDIYAGRPASWVRQHTKDMLNGDVDPEAYEQSYYEAALKMKDFYKDQMGLADDDAISKVESNVAGVQSGSIGEVPRSIRRRFTKAAGQRFADLAAQQRARRHNNNPNP